jgi:hypothetical protein
VRQHIDRIAHECARRREMEALPGQLPCDLAQRDAEHEDIRHAFLVRHAHARVQRRLVEAEVGQHDATTLRAQVGRQPDRHLRGPAGGMRLHARHQQQHRIVRRRARKHRLDRCGEGSPLRIDRDRFRPDFRAHRCFRRNGRDEPGNPPPSAAFTGR